MADVFARAKEKRESPEFRNAWPTQESIIKSDPSAARATSGIHNRYVIEHEAARFHESPSTVANEKHKEKVSDYKGSIEVALGIFGEINSAAENRKVFDKDFFKGPDAEERKAMFLAYASFEGIGKATRDLEGCKDIND
ncbi:MAG: hypothetical protein AB1468_05920, partial [Candidatus Micrarchaeota archaeon]